MIRAIRFPVGVSLMTGLLWTAGSVASAQAPASQQGTPAAPPATAPATSPAPAATWPPPADDTTTTTDAGDASASQLDAASASGSGRDDHERVIGHVGVGFFGIRSIPVGFTRDTAALTGTDAQTLDAPTIGVRYWMNDSFGLEAALGFAVSSGSTSTDTQAGSTDSDLPSRYAFAFHGGVPIAFMHEQHYKFLVIPEINIALGGGTDPLGSGSTDDYIYSSFLFEVGARVGAEVHFGFIGVPQLSLQGTVGANLRYATVNQNKVVGPSEEDLSISAFSVGTTVQQEPWNIFVTNVSAIYYF
jgi:hypothetical protein